jgi:DNA-binding CsgD family transcriptional regulator
MAVLTQRDLERVESFLRRLYTFRRIRGLTDFVLTGLAGLIGSRQTSWNYVAPRMGRAEVMAFPEEPDHMRHQAALERNIDQHPLMGHFLTTGDPNAFKISDFLSRRKFHNTELYDELYRPLRYEDQFAMNLLPPAEETITLVVARESRTFTERHRAMLNLLRPHIAQAYRNVRDYSRLARCIERNRTWAACSYVALDANHRITDCPTRAERWMEVYFPELPRAPGLLPQSLADWVARAASELSALDLGRPPRCLTRRAADRRLIVRLVGGEGSQSSTLLLEERTDVAADGRPAPLGLTPRETEVLLQVEQGKPNNEIAAALGMRPRTVRKHLEHIFDKLGVHNRTSAVAQLHRALRG